MIPAAVVVGRVKRSVLLAARPVRQTFSAEEERKSRLWQRQHPAVPLVVVMSPLVGTVALLESLDIGSWRASLNPTEWRNVPWMQAPEGWVLGGVAVKGA